MTMGLLCLQEKRAPLLSECDPHDPSVCSPGTWWAWLAVSVSAERLAGTQGKVLPGAEFHAESSESLTGLLENFESDQCIVPEQTDWLTKCSFKMQHEPMDTLFQIRTRQLPCASRSEHHSFPSVPFLSLVKHYWRKHMNSTLTYQKLRATFQGTGFFFPHTTVSGTPIPAGTAVRETFVQVPVTHNLCTRSTAQTQATAQTPHM